MLRRALVFAFTFALAAASQAADHAVAVGPGTTFAPENLTINVGDRVIWTRLGGLHNVNADDGSFSNTPSSSWTTFEHVFNSAGSNPYHCAVHSSPGGTAMNGTITVQGGGGSPGSLRFSQASYSIGEAGGSATITVQRTGGDDGAVSVDYETADGTASHLTDYTQQNGPLNWADNDDGAKTFTVPITNDTADESNETISLNLINPGGGASLGSPASATLTINDNDGGGGGPGTIRFTGNSTASVGEAAGTITLNAERVNGTTGAVGATYTTASGTAGSPADFTSASNQLTWTNGDSANKSFTVSIVDDGSQEGNETFTVALSAPTGGASLGSPGTKTVTIVDDDTECIPTPCVPDATTLCLAGGSGDPTRFRIRVTWTDFEDHSGPGMAVPFTPDSGFFYFFDPSNVELLVKMVNACGSSYDSFWFFNAAASNVGLDYELVDTTACVTRHYSNLRGTFASFGDTEAFETCGAAATGGVGTESFPFSAAMAADPWLAATGTLLRADTAKERTPDPAMTPPVAAGGVAPEGPSVAALAGEGGCESCVADDTTLCLAGGSGNPNRFRVRVTWTDFEQHSGPGRAVPFTSDSGFFYFFDPNNLELLVKMVRACGTSYDSYWFFNAAASNVALDYEILDTVACVFKEYENLLGNFASFGDTGAFLTCP